MPDQIAVGPPGDASFDAVNAILFGGIAMIRGNLLLGLRPVAPGQDGFDPDGIQLELTAAL